MDGLLQNFVISFVLLHSHMFPWMNKFFSIKKNFLPCLIKQKSYSCPHCIFQSVYLIGEYVIGEHYSSPGKYFVTFP